METAAGLLARDPLRNIVLLKHLQAYPGHTRLHHVAHGARHVFLVLLEAGVTSWDRAAYPAAAFIVLVSSDGPDLTRALRRQLESPERRHWLGTAGRRRALDVFSWESVAAQTVAVYRQAIARAGVRRGVAQAVDEPC